MPKAGKYAILFVTVTGGAPADGKVYGPGAGSKMCTQPMQAVRHMRGERRERRRKESMMTASTARTFDHVREQIKKEELIKDGMHIVIGFSGGPDSMCLFDMLCRLAEPMRLRLYPVHVNHRFRPGAAEEDQAFAEQFCRQRGWPCTSFVYDCAAIAAKEGLTSEEAGRKARYEAFGKVAAGLLAKGVETEQIAIAVAQNANDQAETILFRILRGTGTDGLAGIAKKRYETIRVGSAKSGGQAGSTAATGGCGPADTAEAGRDVSSPEATGAAREVKIAVIRPLLETPRDEIEQYLAQRQLTARIDHTNAETVYTRNKIRLQLLPYLAEHYNENILAAVNRLGNIAKTDKDYLWQQAEQAFRDALLSDEAMQGKGTCAAPKKTERPADAQQVEARQSADARSAELPEAVYLSMDRLEAMHPAIRTRVYHKALSCIGMAENFSSAQLAAIEKIRISENPSAEIELADGYRAARVYEKIKFDRRAEADASEQPQYRLWRTDTAAYRQLLQTGVLGLHGAFRAGDLPKDVMPEIRTRRDGDFLMIPGGRKKLQDFFVDEKVPKNSRDAIPVLAFGNSVWWILPSKNFRSDRLRQKGRFCADRKVDIHAEETIIILEIS